MCQPAFVFPALKFYPFKVTCDQSAYFSLPYTALPPSSHVVFKLLSQLSLPELGSPLSLSFLTCRMAIVIPILQGCYKE